MSAPVRPASGTPIRYAGWRRRVSAAFLDGVLSVPFVIPGVVALFVGPRERSLCTDFDGVESACDVPTSGTIAVAALSAVVGILTYLVIYVRLLGMGATWGRGAVGYQVVDERTLQPVGSGRAVGRCFAAILSALPCYLGFLWPLWDAENRTFHDMIVHTRAVRR